MRACVGDGYDKRVSFWKEGTVQNIERDSAFSQWMMCGSERSMRVLLRLCVCMIVSFRDVVCNLIGSFNGNVPHGVYKIRASHPMLPTPTNLAAPTSPRQIHPPAISISIASTTPTQPSPALRVRVAYTCTPVAVLPRTRRTTACLHMRGHGIVGPARSA